MTPTQLQGPLEETPELKAQLEEVTGRPGKNGSRTSHSGECDMYLTHVYEAFLCILCIYYIIMMNSFAFLCYMYYVNCMEFDTIQGFMVQDTERTACKSTFNAAGATCSSIF